MKLRSKVLRGDRSGFLICEPPNRNKMKSVLANVVGVMPERAGAGLRHHHRGDLQDSENVFREACSFLMRYDQALARKGEEA